MKQASPRSAGGLPADLSIVLSQLPLFQELTPEQIAQIAVHARRTALLKGEMLFQKGDPARGFFMVLHGQIKLALPSAKGNEKVVDIVGSRQSFGEALMFLDRPYPVFAQAVMDTALIQVPQEVIFDLLASDASFSRRMLAGMSMRLHHLIQDVDTYSKQSGTQRLVDFILQNFSADNEGPQDEPVTFALPATKQLIASRLSLAPETLSRSFHELSEMNLIAVSGSQILIKDLSGLRRYSLDS